MTASPSPSPPPSEFPAVVQPYSPPSPPARTGRLLVLLLVLVTLLVLPYLLQRVQYAVTYGRLQAEVDVAREGLKDLKDTTAAFRLAAQSVGPAVVHIDTEQVLRSRRRLNDELELLIPEQLQSGQGSGVVIDAEGYILTNYHVVATAEQIKVVLSDGRKIEDAAVVGIDPATDLAVLKINAGNLIVAPWGDSEQVQVGDWILAVGNPFGLDRTVTAGIVSAKGRRGLVNGSVYQDFLQTDAAVNPGNSGGPLVNLQGQVVGINTAILGETYQGISFAIPSQMARDVFEKLRESGSVERGWLGIAPQSLTPELAQQLGVQPAHGALVAQILRDSPAERAGLEPGDVIVAINDHEVQDATDLTFQIAGIKPGTKIQLDVIRDAKPLKLEVEVGSRQSEMPAAGERRR